MGWRSVLASGPGGLRMVLFSTDSCDKTMDDDSGAGHEPPRRPIGVVRRPRALLFSTPSKVGDAGVRDGSARAGRTLRYE